MFLVHPDLQVHWFSLSVHVETSTATENGNNIVHESRQFNQRQVLFLGIKVSFLGSWFENSHEEAFRDLFMPGIC